MKTKTKNRSSLYFELGHADEKVKVKTKMKRDEPKHKTSLSTSALHMFRSFYFLAWPTSRIKSGSRGKIEPERRLGL